MRALTFITMLALCASAVPAAAGGISSDDAVSRAQAAGYSLVSKTELATGVWDVWASKDGIPYDVKLNANDGSVIRAVPVEDND